MRSATWLNLLTQDERQEAADAIDCILEFLGLSVRKADPLEEKLFGRWAAHVEASEASIAKVEAALEKLLLESWSAQAQKAIKEAAKVVESFSGPLTQDEVQLIVAAVAKAMGPDFASLTKEEATRLVGTAYLLGRKVTAQAVGLKPKLAVVDEAARIILTEHTVFWIGQHYDAALGGEIAGIVRELALESGLGRVEVGRRLKEALGGVFPKSDVYWRGLAATTVTRARAMGAVQSLVEAEVEEYEIMAMLDERTCELCTHLNGKTFRTEHAVALRDALLEANTPEDVKRIHPWRTLKEIKDWDEEKLAEGGHSLPPYHFHCRCTYVAKTFKEVEGKPLAVEFPSLQPKSTIPGPDALSYVGSGAYLGGAGEKHIYEDASGNKYIFKPAVSKSGVPEPFRAYVQEAASQIAARLYEPGEFVEIKAMALRGRLGTVQPLLAGVKGNLKSITWQSLGPDAWKQIQREHVLDWVIGNFDSHAGNFIYLEGGRVLGIDKEQAFRYLYDLKSWKMSLDYHPNAVYGEQEPLYNTLYRAFAQNKIDLDLQAVLPVLQRLERISDDEYRAILRPYAEALKGKGAAAEDLLDRAVKRKHEVRECYREFFTKLLKMRDPHFKGTFKFLDEMKAPDLRAAPLAAKVLSKAELQAMDVAGLKNLAKAQKIPYYYYLTKAELVEVLSNPDQLTAVTVAARDRARTRLRAARGARQVSAPTAGDVLEDLGRATARGISVRKDKDVLEGQQLNVRRIEDDGRPGFELTCKLTQEYHDKVRSALRRLGGTRDDYLFYGGKLTSTHFGFTRSRYEFAGRAMVLNLPDAEVVFADDANRRALLGQLTIRVYGNDGVTSAQRLKQIFSDLGLDMLAQDPTPEDDRLFRLSRLAWQHAPQEEIRTRRAGRTAVELEDILRRKGIDPARAGKLVEREVWPGYRTFVEEGATSRYKALGAEYLFAGVDDAESVVRILSPDSPGLMSTCERYRFGIFKGGASPGSDIGTGGADSAFARLVPRNARGKRMFRESYKGGGYRLIIDVAELDRTDWYAYGHDAFGITYRDFERRPAAEEFLQRLNREYRPNNEVMFRKGIRKESIIGITCDSYYMRDTLLQEFRRAGIMEVNGRKIEDFIKVQEMV